MTTITSTQPTEPTTEGFDEPHSLSRYVRWTAAAASLVAAGIHFGFAPGHYAEDWRHGLFFILLGWFQIVWAVLLITRPSRKLFLAGLLVSLGTIAVWAVSRTAGLPTWLGGTGERESVTLADQLSTILEGVVVVVSAGLLTRPAWRTRQVAAPRLTAGLGVGAVALALVAASMSLTPSYTAGHSHGGADDHSAAGAHDDHSAQHAAGGSSAEHDAQHAVVGSAANAHTAAVPYTTGKSPCEQATEKYPNNSGEDADPTAGHDHHGPLAQEPIDAATRDKLVEEQKLARAVTEKYPTVKEAVADGYRLSTVYLPCIGAHYTKVSLVAKFDPSTPSELLYDGTAPDAKIIGLSYLLVHPGGAPEGFSGPNDVWHQHSKNGGLCLNSAGVVIGGEQMSRATCTSRGGHKSGLKDIWMVHDWIAPGWECSWGVFAAECPELGGRPGGTSASPLG